MPFDELKKDIEGLPPTGVNNAEIYILGDFPTKRDMLIGKPFSGDSGEILKAILEHLKINPEKVRYNYAVNCKIEHADSIFCKGPSDLLINSYRDKVFEDIKATKPKVIIAMGDSALKCLFNRSEPGIFGWRGHLVPAHEFNCWVLPVFPMRTIIKDGISDNKIQWIKGTNHTDTLKVLREDLAIVPDLIKVSVPEVKPYKIIQLLKFDEIKDFFNLINQKDFFILDFETLGLKPYFKESCILSCAFSFDGETAYALPVSYHDYMTKEKYWDIEQEEFILSNLKQLLTTPRSRKVAHNSVFEMEWAKAILGIDIVNIEDSMLQKYILDCRTGTMNLDFLTFVNYGISHKVYPQSIMSNLTQLSIEELLDYNGKDSIFEYRIFKKQEKELNKDKVLFNVYKEQVETAKTIAQIQYDGACTNEESRNNLLIGYKNTKERLEKEILNLPCIKEFRNKYGKVPALKSNSKDIPIILFKIEGLEPFKKTDKGNYSVDKEVLSAYAEQSQFCELLLQYREYSGIEGKILKSYTECVFPDGKYHTSFRPVETGRLSSKDINLQNLDKRKHPEIRQIIVAPPGHVLLIYDQCFLPETEYLTDRGWIKILDLKETDKVWQVDKTTLKGEFIKPQRIIKKEYEGTTYTFDAGKRGRLTVTENHRMLWGAQILHKTHQHYQDYRKESLSQEGIPNSGSHSICFSYSNKESNYSEKEIWLATLLEADSHYDEKYNKYNIQVSLPRKREKIKELLGYSGKLYETRKYHTLPVEYWSIEFNSSLLKGKNFNLSTLGQNQIKIFKEALIFWDGQYYRHNERKNNREYWVSTNKENIDEVQKYFVINGYECHITQKQNNLKNNKWKPCYTISIKEKGTIRFGSIYSKLSSIKINKEYYKGMVGCVTVDSGYILVRNNGQTFVTGNCQLEFRVIAAVSNCGKAIEMIKTGYDIHMAKAIEIWGEEDIKNSSPKEVKLKRYRAKNELVFPAIYGSMPKAIANRLGISESQAEQLYNKLWSDFPEIREWQEKVLEIYEKKRYVEMPPGRRRHAPLTKNEILNTPIQGGAASIVVKQMNMIVKRKLWCYLNCHDELIVCTKEKGSKYVAEEMEEIMRTDYFGFMKDVPLEVEGSIGYDWYNTIPIKEVF